MGQPSDVDVSDGIMAPRITGDLLRLKSDAYEADQEGAVVYVTSADSAPQDKTINVKEKGYYYFDGLLWHLFLDKFSGNESDLIRLSYFAQTKAKQSVFSLPTVQIDGATNYYQNILTFPIPPHAQRMLLT